LVGLCRHDHGSGAIFFGNLPSTLLRDMEGHFLHRWRARPLQLSSSARSSLLATYDALFDGCHHETSRNQASLQRDYPSGDLLCGAVVSQSIPPEPNVHVSVDSLAYNAVPQKTEKVQA